VLLTDLTTFAVAVFTLALVRFPRPERSATTRNRSLVREVVEGWRYLRGRSGLLWLLFIYAGVNCVLSFTNVLLIPLIVSFATEAEAGAVISAAGAAMLVGSLLVSAWGGPKRRRITWIMGGQVARPLRSPPWSQASPALPAAPRRRSAPATPPHRTG
jgi:DHA3 family macrolide efflux protein-like MFS transporter